MHILGIDIGTTGCKSMLFDEEFKIVAQHYIEYELIQISPSYIEQDAVQWWDMVKETIGQTVNASGVRIEDISALSISSQGISFVPIDDKGQVIYNAVSWLDTRAVKQAQKIGQLHDEDEIFKRTGKRISPAYTLPKIMWMKENKPQIYQRTYKFLMGLDYIVFKMTGEIVTDYSMASGTLAYNIAEKKWDMDILNACGIDKNKLPDVQCTGSIVGKLSARAASEIGLSEDTVVVLGAQDQKCAAIGAGIKNGIATVSLGTSSAISSICSEPIFDPQSRVPCFVLNEDSWILESAINTAGVCIKWLKNTLNQEMTYDEMCQCASSSIPGANGLCFYPHLEGATTPYWRPDVKGFLYGLGLSTSRADIIRAFFEGIVYQIKINIDLHEEITDREINEIRIFGGGAKNAFWAQLISDITQKTVTVLYTPEVANLGAALIAYKAIKNHNPFGDHNSMIEKQYIPHKENCEKYQTALKKYIKFQEKLLN